MAGRADISFPIKTAIISALFLIALAVGISRIVLNAHYTTDVIGGFCYGVVWVIVSFWIIRRKAARPSMNEEIEMLLGRETDIRIQTSERSVTAPWF